jgi:hypothetical protein
MGCVAFLELVFELLQVCMHGAVEQTAGCSLMTNRIKLERVGPW